MLVLTRKVEEAIRIGNDVRLVVLSTARGHVRIGIEAPSGVSVLREEVHVREPPRRRAARRGRRRECVSDHDRGGVLVSGFAVGVAHRRVAVSIPCEEASS